MSVEFIDPGGQQYKYQTMRNSKEDPGPLIKLVIKFSGGKVSTSKGASIILLAIATIIFILSAYFAIAGRKSDTPKDQVGIESHIAR